MCSDRVPQLQTAPGLKRVQRKAAEPTAKHRAKNLTHKTAPKNPGPNPKMETPAALRHSLKELHPLKHTNMI